MLYYIKRKFIEKLKVEIFCLITWNLSSLHSSFYPFYQDYLPVLACRLLIFVQLVSTETVGFLLSLVSIDRLVIIISKSGTVYKKLPFTTRKSAMSWTGGILGLATFLNYDLLMINLDADMMPMKNFTTNNSYCHQMVTTSQLIQSWDLFRIYTFLLVPCIFMGVTNLVMVVKTFRMRKKTSPNNSKVNTNAKKHTITITIIFLILSHVVMNMPFLVGLIMFKEANQELNQAYNNTLFETMAYLNHALLFLIAYLTNFKFRTHANKILKKFKC